MFGLSGIAPTVTDIPRLKPGDWVAYCRRCGYVSEVCTAILPKCFACDTELYAVLNLPHEVFDGDI